MTTNRTRNTAAAAMLSIAAMAALLPGSAHAADPRPQPLPVVSVSIARTGVLVERVILNGTLVPREEVLVGAETDGLAISEILVEEGMVVERGALLARLSQSTVNAQLSQNAAQFARCEAALLVARSRIAAAEATRTQADPALRRSRDLLSTGTATRETVEHRQMAVETAVANVAEAHAGLRVAEADCALALAQRGELLVRHAHTELRAPVAGLISRRTARVGAIVRTDGEPLFRLIADGTVEVDAEVPEIMLARLQPGQPVQVDAAGRHAISGQVRMVAPEVDRQTRLGRVRVALAGSKGFPVGSFARTTVEVDRHGGVLVPLAAVLIGETRATVQMIEDGRVRSRPVEVGLESGGEALITAGLSEGAAVVAVSGSFLRDGDRVRTVPMAPVLVAASSVAQVR